MSIVVVGKEISLKPRLPEFVHSLRLDWTYTDSQTPPADITQHSQSYGAANPRLILDKAEQGKYCHLVAYFVLPDGTPSQASQIVSFMTSTI
ncbi:MAG: hypothetical protein PSN36_05580 [Gammaproteobacteria bacterium]|nr:hypothetical protein [Gammaproteobacteria bacterium]